MARQMVMRVENLFPFLVMEPFLPLDLMKMMEMEIVQDTLEYTTGMVVHGYNVDLI